MTSSNSIWAMFAYALRERREHPESSRKLNLKATDPRAFS